MVKDSGDPLVEHGHEMTVFSEPFKPKAVKGEAKVTFTIDTTDLGGKQLVAFETAYRLEGYSEGADLSDATLIKVAEHKNLKDKGQTVKIKAEKDNPPVITGGPKTGDSNKLRLYVALLTGAFSALAAFAGREFHKYRKRRRNCACCSCNS